MSSSAQLLLILTSILLGYIWLSIPTLGYYSLQLAALLLISYFLIKKISGAKLWHVAPQALSIEMAIFTTVVLLLTGSTGNLESLFFPISYIHIFFLSMTLVPVNACIATFAIMLFHFGLTPDVSPQHLSTLFALPALLVVFLFTKQQYDERKKEEYQNWLDEQQMAHQQTSIGLFLTTFLKPKLEALSHFSLYPELNKESIQKQVTLIQSEISKILDDVQDNHQQP